MIKDKRQGVAYEITKCKVFVKIETWFDAN